MIIGIRRMARPICTMPQHERDEAEETGWRNACGQEAQSG
jgi:hypothetical protein